MVNLKRQGGENCRKWASGGAVVFLLRYLGDLSVVSYGKLVRWEQGKELLG